MRIENIYAMKYLYIRGIQILFLVFGETNWRGYVIYLEVKRHFKKTVF